MSDDSWEARMSARAKQRQREEAQAEAEAERAAVPINPTKPQPWLNGWPRLSDGRTVLIGTACHCVCCGKFGGITCVAFPDGWEPPGPDPQWPFDEDDCPLCVGLVEVQRRYDAQVRLRNLT